MRRTLSLATWLLASAAFMPACFLNAGALESTGTGATSGSSGTAGSSGVGGTAGVGGSLMPICGDGMIDKPVEQCDDANATADDGCTNCLIDEGYACSGEPSKCAKTCGDGNLDLGEQCDDKGVADGDGCNHGCLIEVGWECDNATLPSVCHLSCGDGTLDVGAGEQCDLGAMNGDPMVGCDAQCNTVAGWTCTQPDGDMMPSACTAVCGDGQVVDGVEVCDDANTVDGDGCSKDCSVVEDGWKCSAAGGAGSCVPICGDGLAVGGEQCDDGNMTAGDGCDAGCAPEHTCGNGVVDPTEQCEKGMTGCKGDCTLDPMGVCGASIVIPPADADATGKRVTDYDGDSDGSNPMLSSLAPVPMSCFGGTPNFPVLHRYTTGKRPSIVTVEAMDTQTDASGTFGNTVVWVYRNCPGKSDLDACDDDAGAGNRSKLTTGYLPAQTTLFLVLAGEGGGGDKGKYRLQITEQPVRLFYYNGFPNQANPGLTSQLGDLVSSDAGGDGSIWQNCMPGMSSGCDPVMKSHSGGAFAYADDGGNMMITSTLLQSADIATPNVTTKLFLQYDLRYQDTGGASESVSVDAFNGMTPLVSITYSGAGASQESRVVLSPTISDKLKLRMTYNDGGKAVAPSGIDDIHVYGY